jgi:hypothetical protein
MLTYADEQEAGMRRDVAEEMMGHLERHLYSVPQHCRAFWRVSP